MIFVDRSKVGTPVLFSGKSKSMDEFMRHAKNFSKDKSIEGLPHLSALLTEPERLDLLLLVTAHPLTSMSGQMGQRRVPCPLQKQVLFLLPLPILIIVWLKLKLQ